MIDLHCHLLPGLDDGPRDSAEALAMAKKLSVLGFDTVIATPHVPFEGRIPDPAEVDERCRGLQTALRSGGVDLRVLPAAEHFSSEVPELLAGQRIHCYPRGDTFLMEFPLAGFPPRLDDMLFRIQLKGRTAVIAHVERYPEVQEDPAAVLQLVDRGCLILVNLTSLAGAWSRKAQAASRELLKRGLVDALTTDLHSAGEAEKVEAGLAELGSLVDADAVRRLTVTRPAEIAISAASEGVGR